MGLPGSSATVDTSPGATPMWNWRSPMPAEVLSTGWLMQSLHNVGGG